MIICPTCKEEIEDDSHFCDQCGQPLLYCSSCGRVGKGRRCIYCGGLMTNTHSHPPITASIPNNIPVLTLYNANLDIRIIGQPGAIIGRRQGPYSHYFEQNMFVSGIHAQLVYSSNTGWNIIDKHSSNGTKLNNHSLQPDVPMTLKNGDIITIANVNMQVTVE